jgi:hypothetical protein
MGFLSQAYLGGSVFLGSNVTSPSDVSTVLTLHRLPIAPYVPGLLVCLSPMGTRPNGAVRTISLWIREVLGSTLVRRQPQNPEHGDLERPISTRGEVNPRGFVTTEPKSLTK